MDDVDADGSGAIGRAIGEREVGSAPLELPRALGPDAEQPDLASLRLQIDALNQTTASDHQAVVGTLDELRESLLAVASGEVVAALWDELRDIRASIEELRLATDLAAVEGELRVVRAGVDEVNDRLDDGLVLADEIVTPTPSVPAELRDLLRTLHDDVAAGFEALRGMPSAEGTLADELRSDVVALRRRIQLRAEGNVLSDDQLEQIAEAVARRLGR